MPLYELTADAESDLREIARYTIDQWGMRQAINYANLLEKAFESIANKQLASRTFSDRYPQVRVARCEHHYVFFLRPEQGKPRIIAVLHERMDMLARLAERGAVEP